MIISRPENVKITMPDMSVLAAWPNQAINSYLLEKFWLAREGLLTTHIDDDYRGCTSMINTDVAGEIMSWLALGLSREYMFSDDFIIMAQAVGRVPSLDYYPWIADVYVFCPRYYGLEEDDEDPRRTPQRKLPQEYVGHSQQRKIWNTLWFPQVLQKDAGDYDTRITADELIYVFVSEWPNRSERQDSYSLYYRMNVACNFTWWFYREDPPTHEVLAWRWGEVRRELGEYSRG